MGLCNAAQLFQRMMSSILDGIPNLFCYLEDVLIFTANEQQHQVLVKELFSRLAAAGLMISADKCIFAKLKMTFLGYEVD